MLSAGMMTTLGVWSCQWRELRPINFGSSSASTAQASGQVGTEGRLDGGGDEGGDEEQGYGRRGRGRGRDGTGEYEMVPMKSNTNP